MIIVKFTIVYMVNINMFKNHWNQMLRKRGGEATEVASVLDSLSV